MTTTVERGLPASIECENVILGVLLQGDPGAYDSAAAAGMKAEYCSLDSNRTIYRVLADRFEAGKAVDLKLVADDLKERGQFEAIGGNGYLASLTDCSVPRTNLKWHVVAVKKQADLRQYIALQNLGMTRALDGTPLAECIEATRDGLIRLKLAAMNSRLNARYYFLIRRLRNGKS